LGTGNSTIVYDCVDVGCGGVCPPGTF
jgi:hypothetical protein